MNTKILFSLLFASCFLVNCSRSIDLTFRVPDKFEQRYRTESTATAQTQVMGMDIENVTLNNITYNMKHLGQNAGGLERFKMTYEAVQYEQSTMGQEIIYDSEDPSRTNNPDIDRIYRVLLDNGFELHYDSKGQLVDAPGLKDVMDKMFGEVPEETREMMESQFGGEAMLQALKSMTYYYPESTKIKTGESWLTTSEMAIGGMELIIDTEYTLLDIKNGQIIIQLKSEITSNPEAEGLSMMGMSMKFDIQGTQQGFLYLDESTNWMSRMEMDQYLDGFMNVEGAETENMKIDMKVTTTNLIMAIE